MTNPFDEPDLKIHIEKHMYYEIHHQLGLFHEPFEVEFTIHYQSNAYVIKQRIFNGGKEEIVDKFIQLIKENKK